ncbi:GIY-YIG nuclease family protein [Paenibacillaceae bacterium]|nr:GIY-YIG nuclease family protein [Paenibacillaceae bacterium]
MKQEAEEKRMLEDERKKIEKEEEKYLVEMNRNRELLTSEKNEDKIRELQERIALLEAQYDELEEKKEEIIKRANGKAGHVYVISNLGSFGGNIFKIGMTRRLDPSERIDELGDASVPFKFDVHAMIFSNDAVALEQQIHLQLAGERVNKINMRKEFFYANVESIENLVQDIDPTAEFTTTMIAQEYRQSLSVQDISSVEAHLFEEEEAVS